MNLYWGGAASFAFFMLLGLLAGKLFHIEGPAWYFLMGVMAALGLGSFAIFSYFQTRVRARKEAAGSAGGYGGSSTPSSAPGPLTRPWTTPACASSSSSCYSARGS